MPKAQCTVSDKKLIPLKCKFNIQNAKLDTYAQNAIKKSNVKAFVNQGLRMNEEDILVYNQKSQISGHLLNLKKSDSVMRMNINKRNSESIQLKDNIMYTEQKIQQLANQKYLLNQNIQKFTKDLLDIAEKKQNTLYTFKSYEQIMTRIKRDEITNQIRINALQKKLSQSEKEFKQTQNKLYSITEFEEQCARGLIEAEKQMHMQSSLRQKRRVQMSLNINSQNLNDLKRLSRINLTNSIQEIAAGDLQDADLTRIKKFMHAQIFVKSVLKSKMKKIKEFYNPYEFAFFKIKSQTVVKQASILKYEFFNFESNYEQKIMWVKDLERQILSLEEERKKMKTNLIQLQEYELDLLTQNEAQNKPNNNEQILHQKHIRQNLQKQHSKAQLTMTKLNQWINLQVKRVNNDRGFVQHPFRTTNINFSKVLNYLLKMKNINFAVKKEIQLDEQMYVECNSSSQQAHQNKSMKIQVKSQQNNKKQLHALQQLQQSRQLKQPNIQTEQLKQLKIQQNSTNIQQR